MNGNMLGVSYLIAPYHGNLLFQLHYHQVMFLELILSKVLEEIDLHSQFAVPNIHLLDFFIFKHNNFYYPKYVPCACTSIYHECKASSAIFLNLNCESDPQCIWNLKLKYIASLFICLST